MHRIKQAFSFSSFSKQPQSTKVVLTGANPSLRRKSSFYDLRGKRGKSQVTKPKPARKRVTKFRMASPSNIPVPKALEKLACADCKEFEARGERTSCFNFLCGVCGDGAVSVVRGDRGFCEDCAGEIERRDVRIIWRGKGKGKGKEREKPNPNPLAGPSALREREVLRRAEEEIEASPEDSLCSSTQAVIGIGSRDRDTTAESSRFRNGGTLRMRRKCKKLRLNLKKLCRNEECGSCGDQGCGSVLVDGDGVTIRTCSNESLVLVSIDQEPAYEPVVFNAAQIGSPTGLAHSTWPSAHMRTSRTTGQGTDVKDNEDLAWPSAHLTALVEAGEAVDVEDSEVLLLKQPRMFLRKGRDLASELQEAMDEPISSLTVTHDTVPPNSSDNQSFLSDATTNPISIPRRRPRHQGQISDLDISSPTHPETYHETAPTNYWMELLDLSPSLIESLSPPNPLLVKPSLDSTFSFPQSLADSEFCNELVRTLSTLPEGTERLRDASTQTPSPFSPSFSPSPTSLRTTKDRGLLRPDSPRPSPTSFPISSNPSNIPTTETKNRQQSLDSEVSFMPADHPCDEHRSKITRNLALTSIVTLTSFPKSPHSLTPTPTPSPVSNHPTSPFLFDPMYFDQDRLLHPHPHPQRTPSPPLVPYPSLTSSPASLEFEFRPTLDGMVDSTKPIRPRASTPGPRNSSPGGAWSNKSVSLYAATPEFADMREYDACSRTAVKVRGGERKWKLIGKDGFVRKRIRRIKGRFEDYVATERVKSDLTEKWMRKEYNLGFVVIGTGRPLRMKAKRKGRGKSISLGRWRVGLTKDR